MIIWIILASYFGGGLIALLILDLATHSIRDKFGDASVDTMNKLGETGNLVSPKVAKVLTVIALWLFWVVAIYGALTSKKVVK